MCLLDELEIKAAMLGQVLFILICLLFSIIMTRSNRLCSLSITFLGAGKNKYNLHVIHKLHFIYQLFLRTILNFFSPYTILNFSGTFLTGGEQKLLPLT